MRLPKAGATYNEHNEQDARAAIEAEDARNFKKNTDFGYFTEDFGPVFKSPDGTLWRQTVDNTGAVVNVVIS